LKAKALDSVSSPITKRVYNMALEEYSPKFRASDERSGSYVA
jgi:hypothetical protein